MSKPTELETVNSNDAETKRPRVLICEDSVLLQEAIRAVVEPECEIAGLVEDGRIAIEMIMAEQPDIVLVDVSLPGASGFVIAETAAAANARARILFVTAYSDRAYVQRAFDIGASGYVLKDSIRTELLPAIRTALNGGHFRSARLP
jgi:DNA-binding NarL/FixJ family response regulator